MHLSLYFYKLVFLLLWSSISSFSYSCFHFFSTLMAMQQSPSSSSSFSYGFTYDVLLSFRGSDTRYGFTGNLYKALCDKGIHTFIDDRELHGGDEITPALVKAIEESRILIPVFSINYASSSFCLDELVHIIHCFKAKGRPVSPVFYDVDPSHVRHQTGSFGKGLAELVEERFKKNKHRRYIILIIFLVVFLLYFHGSTITHLLLLFLFFLQLFLLQNFKESYSDNMVRLQKWKMALKQAANFSGHHFNLGNEYEYDFIQKIVNEVSKKMTHVPLHVADYPVGLEYRLLQVNSLLDVGSGDAVFMIGICGIGGIGKTTLARATYNLIADQFESLCFLHNVREKSTKYGLEKLQEKLLAKTIGLNVKLGDVNEGIPTIKKRLSRKKVLLILDDVDELKQLQNLAGGFDWFGPGSRVIITTRYKHLLKSHGIERSYEEYGLSEREALELLRWKAFKNNEVDSSYASGLPLALEVVGSNLFGKHIEEWKSMLDWYARIPDKKIQEVLKVSFDALEEYEQRIHIERGRKYTSCSLRLLHETSNWSVG